MQVVVITGSAIGIGAALVDSYSASGAKVFALDLQPQSERTDVTNYQCDIAQSAEVEKVFQDIARRVSHVDLLINNAGVWNDTRLSKGTYATQSRAFDEALGGGLMGSYYCTLAALPLLEQSSSANVINMLTEHIVAGRYITGMPATGYDCAKFGLWRLTESWAMELAKKNIRVNGLNFGATDTPMLRAVSVEAAEAGMLPEDIVSAVKNIVAQGPEGDTGKAYLFGTNGSPLEESRKQIEALKTPIS